MVCSSSLRFFVKDRALKVTAFTFENVVTRQPITRPITKFHGLEVIVIIRIYRRYLYLSKVPTRQKLARMRKEY